MNRSSDRFGADRRPRPDRAEAVMADKEQTLYYRVTGVLPHVVLAVVIGDRLSKVSELSFSRYCCYPPQQNCDLLRLAVEARSSHIGEINLKRISNNAIRLFGCALHEIAQ